MILSSIGIFILIVVAVLIYSSDSKLSKRFTDFSSDDEYANATAVLNIPAGEEGEAPGACKVSFISKSSAYPVAIGDISTFYEFSETVAPCENGMLTLYNSKTSSPEMAKYVNIVLDNDTKGELKTDESTNVTYSTEYSVSGETASLYIAIDETDDTFTADEIVRSILLTEIESLFNGTKITDLMSEYSDLSTMGLVLSN